MTTCPTRTRLFEALRKHAPKPNKALTVEEGMAFAAWALTDGTYTEALRAYRAHVAACPLCKEIAEKYKEVYPE